MAGEWKSITLSADYYDCGMEPMDTSEVSWYWFYQAECNIWHRIEDDPVSPISSSELERYYLCNPRGVLKISAARGCFKIDFSENTQTNLTTGHKRQLKRSCFTESTLRCPDQTPVPPEWEEMDPKEPYQAFCLKRNTQEFTDIVKYVEDIGLLGDPIKNIYRIQNRDLWELYCRKKAQLMKIRKQPNIEEQMLFHGTSKDNLHSICTYNFDCRLYEQLNGHVYGKGTYFAKHASYANRYSQLAGGADGVRVMFLARVMVGKYTTGEPSLCKPDRSLRENIHDSCVDNILCPRIFVIFIPDISSVCVGVWQVAEKQISDRTPPKFVSSSSVPPFSSCSAIPS